MQGRKGNSTLTGIAIFLAMLLWVLVSLGRPQPVDLSDLTDALSGLNRLANEIPKNYRFNGYLDRTSPCTADKFLSAEGTLFYASMKNVIYASETGTDGIECRPGSTPFHTTPISGVTVRGIFQCQNVEHDLNAFYAQCNDTLQQAARAPPTTGSLFGTTEFTLPSGTDSLIGEKINDDLVLAGSGTTPIAHSGGTAWPDGFRVQIGGDGITTGGTNYVEGWDKVRNDREDLYIKPFYSGAVTYFYIGYRRKLSGFSLDLLSGGTNAAASGITVAVWDGEVGVWSGVAGLSDGTAGDASGTSTMYELSGKVSWTYDGDEDPLLLANTKDHLYWYRAGVTTSVDTNVKIWRVRVHDEVQAMTSLWSGLYESALGCLYGQEGTSGLSNYVGEVTDGLDTDWINLSLLDSNDYLYVGFANRAKGIYFQINQEEGVNLEDVSHIKIDYWDVGSASWTAISGVTRDTTRSTDGYAMHNSGLVYWQEDLPNEGKRMMESNDILELYWYRIKWSSTFTADTVALWSIAQIENPDSPPPMWEYDFVLEYNDRALWGPGKDQRHGLDFSMDGYPHILTGPMAGSTGDIFGPGRPNAACRISGWALVSTEGPPRLYLMQGKVPGKFDSLLILHTGAVNKHCIKMIEDDIRRFSSMKGVQAGIMLSRDGVYLAERIGIKISGPIQDYWDTGSTPYIEPGYIDQSYIAIDYEAKIAYLMVPVNNRNSSVVQTTPNVILPYHWPTDTWLDQWEYAQPMYCGTSIVTADDRRIVYAGDGSGTVHRLGVGDNDGGSAIQHSVETIPVFPLHGIKGEFDWQTRHTRVEGLAMLMAQGDGTVDVWVHPDDKDGGIQPSGTTDLSMSRSGYGITSDYVSFDRDDKNLLGVAHGFKFESGATIEETFNLYGFTIYTNRGDPGRLVNSN